MKLIQPTQSNAERQAAYRQRHLSPTGISSRLNCVIEQPKADALSRMAKAFGLTKRETIEEALGLVEAALLNQLPVSDRAKYFAGTLTFSIEALTFYERS